MQVTFTKVGTKRYLISIERDRGPALVPRLGPGYDDFMPHDLAHYLVEEHFGIELGVWGQLAAGGGGIFTPPPEDNTLQYQRRAQRIGAVGREDMARSEELVVIAVAPYERSTGRLKRAPRPVTVSIDEQELQGAVRRLDEVAQRWHALQLGAGIALTWPRQLMFDPSRSRRGRRPARQASAPVRR